MKKKKEKERSDQVYSAVQGFDKVGKSAVIERILDDDQSVFYPNYEKLDNYGVSRNYLALMSYGFFKILPLTRNTLKIKLPLFDRDLLDSYVYSRLYPGIFKVPYAMLVDYYRDILSYSGQVSLNYVCHSSLDSLREIFMKEDGEHEDKLDPKTLESYLENYRKANKLYLKTLEELSSSFIFNSRDFQISIWSTTSQDNGEYVSLQQKSFNKRIIKEVLI